jgi:multimeric flavodoxin WrbA
MADVLARVAASDLVIMACPVYVFNIPSQFRRFIEILFDESRQAPFAGKYAACITTSINFFDNTAHAYLRSVCEDLGMNFAGAFSADSYDLLDETQRSRLLQFAGLVFDTVRDRRPCSRACLPLVKSSFQYQPSGAEATKLSTDKKVVIVMDAERPGSNLPLMVRKFAENFENAEVLNLSEVNVSGGCLGCIQCGFDHKCVYGDKDGMIEFYESKIKPADILVFAGDIKDRFLSSIWKQFFDRGFYNTHTPTMTGKQISYILSGPLGQIANLREVLEAFTEWQGANLVDIITDEPADNSVIDALISETARKSLNMALSSFVKPATFLGKAGMKMFRDDVFGRHRFVFQADHAYFESHGIYDFPQDDKRAMDTNKTMFELTSDPQMRDAIRKMLKTEMVKPHQKIVETK